ncbi:uncharacterized protein [Amphiura filiformis]|uniref:uncharacterized protein n=1 Tax=Amphiura filiformis TaxID=82378 RepID=UPI003B2257C7
MTSHLRNKRFVFVTNLALTDLCAAAVVSGFVLSDEISWLLPIQSALLVASVFNILAVAVDRSIALKWAPLQYDVTITTPRCLIVSINYATVFRSISSVNIDMLGQKQASIRQKQSWDILITFSLILGSSFFFLCTILTFLLEQGKLLLDSALLTASVCNILAVAVDRSIALKWAPLRYDVTVTVHRCLVVCILIWIIIFSIYLSAYYLQGYAIANANILMNCFRPIFIMILILITAINYAIVFRSISSANVNMLGQKQASIRQKQSRNILITFSLILGSNFFCWLPMCICLIVQYVYRNSYLPKGFWFTMRFNLALLSLNLALNPAIFLWRHPRRNFYLPRRLQTIMNYFKQRRSLVTKEIGGRALSSKKESSDSEKYGQEEDLISRHQYEV